MPLTIQTYSELPTWGQKFNNQVNLKEIKYHKSWDELFNTLLNHENSKKIEQTLSQEKDIFPKPDLLFNAFYLTPLDTLKVVFIGQDPYFNCETHDNLLTPQAMGLSFSVPVGVNIPSSLSNIFINLKKYNHIKTFPKNGNLEHWATQGCLMLNSSLTVKNNDKNCHQNLWTQFTDYIIKYISDTQTNIIFVLWGSFALQKKQLIDTSKHVILASSHPSGLSANKPLNSYPPFSQTDHFGKINDQLKTFNKTPINFFI